MVYNVHEKADKVTGVIKPDGRGKHCNHHRVSSEDKENVLAHIISFPLVDSHYYCRPKTNKKYLESGLKIEKMYDLNKRNFIENERPFVKSSYYRFIFNTCFNIGFHVPKTDRCERCEEMKIKGKEIVADGPNKTDFIYWSDSCVPQSRNSHISQAILEFLQITPSKKSVTLKNSIVGHSCVQEVENIHKQIEDDMRVAEFYSPVSSLRYF